MPAMLNIDTRKFARSLADDGLDPRQVEALVRGLSEADTSDFATSADMAEIRSEVSAMVKLLPSTRFVTSGSRR